MNKVYCKVSLELLDDLTGFFKKLHAFVGDFTIEGEDKESWLPMRPIVISFYTDKIQFAEGEQRLIELQAKRDEKGDWDFSDIKKF